MVAILAVMIVIGILGNVMSVIVLSRRQMRAVPIYTLLLILAVADAVMVTWVMSEYCDMLINSGRDRSEFYCAIFHATVGSLTDLSSMLTIIVAVVHCACACCCCHLRKTCATCCGQPRVVIWGVVIVILSIVANIHLGVCSRVFFRHCLSTCTATNTIFVLKKIVVEIVVIVLVFFFTCRIVRNCRACLPPSYQTLYNDNAPDDNLNPTIGSSSSRGDVGSKLTVTIFTLLIVFLVSNVPLTAVVFVYIRSPVLLDLAMALWCANYCVKFFVYLATAPDFRRELGEMLTSLRLLHSSISSSMRHRETLAMDETSAM